MFIELDNVSVDIPIYDGRAASLKSEINNRLGGHIRHGRRPTVSALADATLKVSDGDRVGLIGSNGSGKTTLLRVMAGIYEPTKGCVRVVGRTCALLDLTLGMDVEATGVENIYLRGYTLGMSRKQLTGLEREISAFTELGDYLHFPVRTYSAGMMLRLAFAVSISAPHEILLIDEVVGAGDAVFLAKARARVDETISRSRILVTASHSTDLLRKWCNKGIYLKGGRIAAMGPIGEVLDAYTKGEGLTRHVQT